MTLVVGLCNLLTKLEQGLKYCGHSSSHNLRKAPKANHKLNFQIITRYSKMKFSAAIAIFAATTGLVAAEKGPFGTAKWCCFDSNEKCGDACAAINDCQFQLDHGEISDINDCKVFTLEAMGLTAIDTPAGSGAFGLNRTITIEEVPGVCREYTSYRCCDAMDGYVCGGTSSCVSAYRRT